MTRVRIRTEAELTWERASDRPRSNEELKKLGDGELKTRIRIHEPGTETTPQLIEIAYEPNSTIQPHAHDEDEIIYILEGEMRLGTRIVGPGSSIYIAGGTLYGFSVGSEGLRILNFRPHQDVTFITRSEFMTLRAKRAADIVKPD
jgi:quercetin dioxygenase-like cupin family protein